jgi:predicted nucleic acid-binding protein
VILVDTSVWIDYLASRDGTMQRLLEGGLVLGHPFVTGEIAMGQLKPRAPILDSFSKLPRAVTASHAEVMTLMDRQTLYGMGIGYVDAHLLSSALLTDDCAIWTRDKRLARAASKIGVPIFGI